MKLSKVMKPLKLFVAIALCIVALSSCNLFKKGEPQTEPTPVVVPDTIVSETGKLDWNINSAPIFIMCDWMANIHVVTDEVDSALIASNVNTYNTFACHAGTSKLSYKKYQPGEAGFGNLVKTDWETGFLFDVEEPYFDPEDEFFHTYGLALNDAFLNDHQMVFFKAFNAWKDEMQKAPASLLKSLREKYNNAKVKSSTLNAKSNDGSISIYSVQFQPKDSVYMAMRVVTVGDSMYIYDDTTIATEEYCVWHVDDGGEYSPIAPIAISKGKDGLDIFYVEGSPESTSLHVMLLRDGQIFDETLSVYYNYVDFMPPLKPVQLPSTAVLQDEQLGYKVWINEDKKPSEDFAGEYSVYYSQPKSENVYFLLKTNPDLSAVNYQNWPDKYFQGVEIDKVFAASEAKIVPLEFDQVGVVLSGCPDSRNVFSYLVRINWNHDPTVADWLPANSGFVGLDDDKNFMLTSYRYDDNGRYDVIRRYTRLGQFVSEDRVDENGNQEFVDLGLSVKWASCNLGADRVDAYGNFYAWGEIEPKPSYDDNSYRWNNLDQNKLRKEGVIDDYGCLASSHDAAISSLGNGWRMPTAAEFEELAEKCKWEEDQYPSDVRGYKITGPSGKSIFLPTGGEMSGKDNINFGFYGNYWTSSVDGAYAKALRYSIPDDSHSIQRYNREAGFNIRAVRQ